MRMRVESIEADLARLAPLDTPVLLLGETGVGKGVVARRIHQGSPRREAPFVHLDCGALAPGLLESELFGHERGAFTGAVLRHVGKFERAACGTILLDEIGELAPPQQVKLLHVLQERAFERVGGNAQQRLNARVIVATHRDLAEEVRTGRFRADLYFRIAVAKVSIPPLRERPGEIASLVCEGFDRIKARLSLPLPQLGAGAFARLEQDPWPGNVRQLFNALERLAILYPGRLIGAPEVEAVLDEGLGIALSLPHRSERVGIRERTPVASSEAERARIAAALRDAGGNVSRTARHLGMARTTLRRRLVALGLSTGQSTGIDPDPRAQRSTSLERS